jgi:hypothetical protein
MRKGNVEYRFSGLRSHRDAADEQKTSADMKKPVNSVVSPSWHIQKFDEEP